MYLRKLTLALVVLITLPQSSEAYVYAYKRLYKESQKLNLFAYGKPLLPSPRVLMEKMRILSAISLLLPLEEETLFKSVRDVAAPLIMQTTTEAIALHDKLYS